MQVDIDHLSVAYMQLLRRKSQPICVWRKALSGWLEQGCYSHATRFALSVRSHIMSCVTVTQHPRNPESNGLWNTSLMCPLTIDTAVSG